jgi:D-aspartate ligase
MDTSTPVLLLQSIAYGGLGIARSLGRLGVRVYALESKPLSPISYSRYCEGKFSWSIEDAAAEETLHFLFGIAPRLGRLPLLIPTTDNAALFVAAHQEVLKDWYCFPHQPERLVEALCSKKMMYHLAKAHGVPTAETTFPESHADVAEFAWHANFPVMLKASDGARLFERTGKKMFIVRSARELLELYDRYEEPGNPNLMLQEYIPGEADSIWMFNGYFDKDSECLIGFTGQKLRQCPAYTGYTSLGICRHNATVVALTKRFMKQLGYRGILDIGYRYDARDGQYKVLDINPRIGATFRLFAGRDGMDVARAFYLDMTGQAVAAAQAPEGRKWIVEDRDLAASLRYFLDGKLRPTEWLRSFRGVRESAYFAGDDLLPCFMRGIALVLSPFRQAWRAITKPAHGRASAHIAQPRPSLLVTREEASR